MDNYSYQDWHLSHGISERLLKKMFLPLSLALKFVTPQDISARIVLDVSGIFLRQNNASRMGFLPGSPDKHLIGPLADYIRRKGGTVTTHAKIISMELDSDGNIAGLCIQRGESSPELVKADGYVMALPIHNLKRLIPHQW